MFCYAVRQYNYLSFNFNLLYVTVYFYGVGMISMVLWPPLKVSHKLHTLTVYLLIKQTSAIICGNKTLHAFWVCPKGVAAQVHLSEVKMTR